jgi:membrane protein DedA with SNARE-associated domain
MSIEAFIQSYGYLAIIAGAFFEGETVVVTAGFLARREYLELPWVMFFAVLGAYAGDQVFFHLGRLNGKGLLERKTRLQLAAEKVRRWMGRHDNAVVLGFRFVYGIRIATPIVLGMSGYSPLKFLLLNGVGAIAWVSVMASAGYVFGYVFEHFLTDIRRYEHVISAVLLLMGLAVWLVVKVRSRRRLALAGPGNPS